MGEKIKETIQQKATNLLLILLLFSIFLLPSFKIVSGFPKVNVSDMLTPFFAVFVLMNFKAELISSSKYFIYANIVVIIVSLISLSINHRFSILRDDFEIMKKVKFLIVFFFVIIAANQINSNKVVRVIFILVCLFNFLHYTDLFGFNDVITRYYGRDLIVDTFGLNSLGQDDTKRIIGTVGNPNNNAILFLFFVIYFFPDLKSSTIEKVFFVFAIFGTFTCQSRTGFIAFIIVFFVGSLIKKYSIKTSLLFTFLFLSVIFLLNRMGNVYLNTIDLNLMKQNSVQSRMDTWLMLWEMIKLKPFWGYSPYKDYFYNSNIYSESEYFLNAWRYGFLGLIAYIIVLWTSFISSIKMRFTKSGFCLSMFTIVIAITALTNNPLSDPMIYMMYAVYAGLFFSDKIKLERVTT